MLTRVVSQSVEDQVEAELERDRVVARKPEREAEDVGVERVVGPARRCGTSKTGTCAARRS
jgi:hypothetical protein